MRALRTDGDAFVGALSVVAEVEGTVVGHALLTRIRIEAADGAVHESLALAPVAVRPDRQRQGIGSELIRRALERAAALGFSSVVVLGHAAYYPRFGFRRASEWGIRAPFPVPDEAFMAVELTDGGLSAVSGTVVYPKAFDAV
ncbi:MAG: N-acetyltransferase [Prevotella sp.]|nr:N-acetyltransferase [Prevotella sp.]